MKVHYQAHHHMLPNTKKLFDPQDRLKRLNELQDSGDWGGLPNGQFFTPQH